MPTYIVYGRLQGNGELVDPCQELSPLDIAGGVLAIVVSLFLCLLVAATIQFSPIGERGLETARAFWGGRGE